MPVNSFLYPSISNVGQTLLPPSGVQQINPDLLRQILGLAQSPVVPNAAQGINLLGGTQGLQREQGLRLQDRGDRETFGQSNVGPSGSFSGFGGQQAGQGFSGLGSQAGPSGTPGFGGVPSGSQSTVSTPGMSPGMANAIASGLTGLASFGIGAVGGPVAGLVASAIGRSLISPYISNALQAPGSMSFDDFLGQIDSNLAEQGIEVSPVGSPFDEVPGLQEDWNDLVDQTLGIGDYAEDVDTSDLSEEAAAGMDAEAEAEDAAEAGGAQDEDDSAAEDEGDGEGDEGDEGGDDDEGGDGGGDDDDDSGDDDDDDDDE